MQVLAGFNHRSFTPGPKSLEWRKVMYGSFADDFPNYSKPAVLALPCHMSKLDVLKMKLLLPKVELYIRLSVIL